LEIDRKGEEWNNLGTGEKGLKEIDKVGTVRGSLDH
jgi:hypothetical protein